MRRIDCGYYHHCISRSAGFDVDLECYGCISYHPVAFETSPDEVAGCLALLMAIFNPTLYQGMRCLPGLKTELLRAFLAVQTADRHETVDRRAERGIG